MRKVVVSADGSPGGRAAVRWCAGHLDPDTTVLAVCGVDPVSLVATIEAPGLVQSCNAASEEQFKEHWCAPLRQAGLRCEYRFAQCPQIVALREICEREHPDALVVGKRRHLALLDAVLRDPVARLIHRPPCPIVVVPIEATATHGPAVHPEDGPWPRMTSAGQVPMLCQQAGSSCLLLAVSREDNLLVLDILVSNSSVDQPDHWAPGAPIALCAYLPDSFSAAAGIEATLRSWADNATTVAVSLDTASETPSVRLLWQEIAVTLPLDRRSLLQ